jgi:hypothetical protein
MLRNTNKSNLPGIEVNLNNFITDLFGQDHLDTLITFFEFESTVVQESLNIFKLGVVIILILDFSFQGFVELGTRFLNGIERSERAHLLHFEKHV